jgi:hypothetical protein
LVKLIFLAVKDIVAGPAITQSIKGLFTAGLSTSFRYAAEKVKKKLTAK